MARNFVNASAQYLENTAAVVTATPFAISAWFYPKDTTTGGTVMGVLDLSDGTQHHILRFNILAGEVSAYTRSGGTNTAAHSGNTFSANTWNHAFGRWNAANERLVILNDGTPVSNSTSATPTGIDTTRIGRGVSGFYADAYLAEVAVWQVSDFDYARYVPMLAAGYSPLLIKPESLVAYWSLIGRTSPEIDLVGGFDMTLIAGPTVTPHPPKIIHPASDLLSQPEEITHVDHIIYIDDIEYRASTSSAGSRSPAYIAGGVLASDSQPAYIDPEEYFPFDEPFTVGSNDDPWRLSHWTTGTS